MLTDGEHPTVRLLLDADDHRSIEHAVAGGAIAVTATNVRNLRSVQLKGQVRSPAVVRAEDAERAQRYMEGFFGDISDTDGTSPTLLERFVPSGFVACTIEVHERFDQTPGPEAGGRVTRTP